MFRNLLSVYIHVGQKIGSGLATIGLAGAGVGVGIVVWIFISSIST